MEDTKVCTKCGEEKPLTGFLKTKWRLDGYEYWCRACKCAYDRKWRTTRAGRRSSRSAALKNLYGISIEDYEALQDRQGGKCWICGKASTEHEADLCVDHCHDTGAVRGLLCRRCNSGIGFFEDNPDLVWKAVEYLTKEEDT